MPRSIDSLVIGKDYEDEKGNRWWEVGKKLVKGEKRVGVLETSGSSRVRRTLVDHSIPYTHNYSTDIVSTLHIHSLT
jgi:hypothetical protein